MLISCIHTFEMTALITFGVLAILCASALADAPEGGPEEWRGKGPYDDIIVSDRDLYEPKFGKRVKRMDGPVPDVKLDLLKSGRYDEDPPAPVNDFGLGIRVKREDVKFLKSKISDNCLTKPC